MSEFVRSQFACNNYSLLQTLSHFLVSSLLLKLQWNIYIRFPDIVHCPCIVPGLITTELNVHIDLHRLFVEVSSSHTEPVTLPWISDQLVAEAATYTTHNEHKR